MYITREALAAKVKAGEPFTGASIRRDAGGGASKKRLAMLTDKDMAVVTERLGTELVGRVVPFVISTEGRCDDGLAVPVDAWDTKEYERAPMVLWQHNAWSRARIADSVVMVDNDARELVALAAFYPRDLSIALDGGFSWALGEIAAYHGHRASVGFDLVEASLASEDVRKVTPWALDVSKARLREWSLVNMGMDDQAISGGRASGLDTQPIADVAARLLDEGGLRDAIRAEVEKLYRAAAGEAPFVLAPDDIRGAVKDALSQLPRLPR